jgi:hypothetical protein
MKITIKNIKFSESLSEETNAFTADIFVDNKKIGYARNDGQGGNTNCQPYPETKDKFREVDAHFRSLPDIQYDGTFGKMSLKQDIEYHVDEAFEAWLETKENKKFLANMDKGLLYGTKECYRMISWRNSTLTAQLQTASGLGRVKQLVLELKAKGETILNTNLPNEIL